jgi:hypothetical protein
MTTKTYRLHMNGDKTGHAEFLAALAKLRVALPNMTSAETTEAILVLVEALAGSPSAARDWTGRVIPSLATSPAELLADGRGALLLARLEGIAHGGYS